uniref:Interleukin family protein n=1 Tax=Ficedula albicollis TaxID=59894 RepID=A0A803V6W2_FICAL
MCCCHTRLAAPPCRDTCGRAGAGTRLPARLCFVQTHSQCWGLSPTTFPRRPQGSLGCQSVSELMEFYMEEVLPSAMSSSSQHQHSVGDLGNLLLSLRAVMRRCHRSFTCEERSTSMKHIKENFSKMSRNGIYKAMGEFDIFINYIEKYLTMRRGN